MIIEEKISLAISDLEGLLADGVDVDSAIFEIAKSYDLSGAVVRLRGERALGVLETVYAKRSASKAAALRHLRLKAIGQNFYTEESCNERKAFSKLVSVDDWTRYKMGDSVSDDELKFVREIVQRDVARALLRELDEMPDSEFASAKD